MKTRERMLFCLQINPRRVLFSFPSCDWLYFLQSWHVSKKRTRAHLECLAIKIINFVNAFCNKALMICCENGLHLRKKKISMHLSRYEKTWLINRFGKSLENYVPYIKRLVFFFFWNYAPRAEWCDFASAHNSGSPEQKQLIVFADWLIQPNNWASQSAKW